LPGEIFREDWDTYRKKKRFFGWEEVSGRGATRKGTVGRDTDWWGRLRGGRSVLHLPRKNRETTEAGNQGWDVGEGRAAARWPGGEGYDCRGYTGSTAIEAGGGEGKPWHRGRQLPLRPVRTTPEESAEGVRIPG